MFLFDLLKISLDSESIVVCRLKQKADGEY